MAIIDLRKISHSGANILNFFFHLATGSNKHKPSEKYLLLQIEILEITWTLSINSTSSIVAQLTRTNNVADKYHARPSHDNRTLIRHFQQMVQWPCG